MKNKILFSALSLSLLCSNCGNTGNTTAAGISGENGDTVSGSYYTMEDFASVKKFNSHVHISVFDSIFIKQAEKDNFKFLTVNVNSPAVPVDEQQQVAVKLIHAIP